MHYEELEDWTSEEKKVVTSYGKQGNCFRSSDKKKTHFQKTLMVNQVHFNSVFLTFTRTIDKAEIKCYVFSSKNKPQLVGLILFLPAVTAAFLNIESVN